MRVELPDKIGLAASVLTDGDIGEAVAAGFLIKDGFQTKALKYSSYELHAGTYMVLDPRDLEKEEAFYVPADRNDEWIVLMPGETAKVWTLEWIDIPDNVLGRVTTVGQIFASGIAAASTFADPGFRGHLYLTLSNVSNRTLEMPVGCPLARIEFYKLGRSVLKSHGGQDKVRKSFVRPSRPPMLTAAELEGTPEQLIARLESFSDAERYDGRHCISARVLRDLDGSRRRLDRRLDAIELALYLIVSCLIVSLVVALWPLLPDSAEDAVWKWLIPVLLAALLAAVGLASKRFRATARRLLAADEQAKAAGR